MRGPEKGDAKVPNALPQSQSSEMHTHSSEMGEEVISLYNLRLHHLPLETPKRWENKHFRNIHDPLWSCQGKGYSHPRRVRFPDLVMASNGAETS